MKIFPKKPLTQIQLILIVSAFLVIFDNGTFFAEVLKAYPSEGKNLFYLATIPVLMFIVHALFFTLLSSRWTTKPILIFVLLVSSAVAYFASAYHVIIDKGMIQNTLETNPAEAMGLMNLKLILYILLLGILPAWWVWKVPVEYRSWKRELWSKLKTVAILVAVTLLLAWVSGSFYSSFFRENRYLRKYANPAFWIENGVSYTKHAVKRLFPVKMQRIGLDAKVGPHPGGKPILAIFVVGEALRWDHFGLNGYERPTTPLLAKEPGVIDFSDFRSCATFTAKSVPCMFSRYDRSDFSRDKERSTENLMDLLAHTGAIDLLWRDNNSDDKGVMRRLKSHYENYRTSEKNPVCENGECRDIGMLVGLDRFIENNASRDKLIVLHMMGNHGPEYYKRYPKAYEKYRPVCRSNMLEDCSRESIVNAYDNIVGYSDEFLKKTIDLLKRYEDRYQPVLIYIADHGESLGENGIYLHGLPYLMAPEAQKHVAAFLWIPPGFKNLDTAALARAAKAKRFSHDNIFSTIIGLFDINSSSYRPEMDILAPYSKKEK
ncbi:phosphoethanolamine transferase [Nitratifractor sp.]